MTDVFADTFYWIALANPGDQHFEEAMRLDAAFSEGIVYTTEEVLTELVAFFATNRWQRGRAVDTVRQIISDPAVHIFPQSHESFASGFDLYAARLDKGYSLTDCISMQTMRREGLTHVLTNDHHSEQEGFQVLFRKS